MKALNWIRENRAKVLTGIGLVLYALGFDPAEVCNAGSGSVLDLLR